MLRAYEVIFSLVAWTIVQFPQDVSATRRGGLNQENEMLERKPSNDSGWRDILLRFPPRLEMTSTSTDTGEEQELKKKYAGYVNALCPPVKRGTHDFVMMGPTYPPVGGCIATGPLTDAPVTLGFEIWMGSHGSCDTIGHNVMKYSEFDCVSKWTEPSLDGSKNFTFTMLKDMASAQSLEESGLRCSVYDSTDQPKYDTEQTLFRFAISANKECDGLKESLFTPHKTIKRWHGDRINVFLLPKETRTMIREPRDTSVAASLDAGCRFPEWMQGQWTDVNVDANTVRYARVGGGGDAETTETTETDGYRVRSSRSVESSGSAKTRRSASPEPGVNGNVLGMSLARIFFPEWYKKDAVAPTTTTTTTTPRRLRKRDVLNTVFNPFVNICIGGFLCVHPNPPESPPASHTTTRTPTRRRTTTTTTTTPTTTTTTTRRTTTVDYTKLRDYAMDPAERYNRFNDPFNNRGEFGEEKKPRFKRTPDHDKNVENFQWRCAMPFGDQFLVFGGQNDQNNTTIKSFACLALKSHGVNVMEFSVTGAGKYFKSQGSLNEIASKLCQNKNVAEDMNRPQKWTTVTKKNEIERRPVTCPVLPGMTFVGKVPAPPVESGDVSNAPTQLCAKLSSRADDCTDGLPGPDSRMRFIISECDPDSPEAPPILPKSEPNEAPRGRSPTDRHGGNLRRYRRDGDVRTANHESRSSPPYVAPSTAADEPATTTPPPAPRFTPPVAATDPTITATPPATATGSTPDATTTAGRGDESSGHRASTTVVAATTTTTTTTTTSPMTAFRHSSPDATATYHPTPDSNPADDYRYRQRQPNNNNNNNNYNNNNYNNNNNNNNNDYYYQQTRPQHYPPPPPPPPPLGSSSADYDYYYRQRQQQWLQMRHQHQQQQQQRQWPQQPDNQWPQQQQQQPQKPPSSSHQRPYGGGDDYYNDYDRRGHNPQQVTAGAGGRRTDDYYYRQQQQQQQQQHDYRLYQHHQQQTAAPSQGPDFGQRNTSVASQSNGGRSVQGARPLYVSSGVGGDGRPDSQQPPWSNGTGSGADGTGGWSTAAQQHWWHQQQLQQQRHRQQQHQQQQWQQQWQQDRRGATGILSLAPVPLPPTHADQAPVTVSTGAPPQPRPPLTPLSPLASLPPRAPQKPSDHYYVPTATTRTDYPPYRPRPEPGNRYLRDNEYQCLAMWSEVQNMTDINGKPITFTYVYTKRLNPQTPGSEEFDCFVGTTIPNDPGMNDNTTTMMMTTAGSGFECSRLANPFVSGMKLIGTTSKDPAGRCASPARPPGAGATTAGGTWYPLKPQQIPQHPAVVASTTNPYAGGKWYAGAPVPVAAPNPPPSPTNRPSIITGRQTVGNGHRRHQNIGGNRPASSGATNISVPVILFSAVIFGAAAMI